MNCESPKICIASVPCGSVEILVAQSKLMSYDNLGKLGYKKLRRVFLVEIELPHTHRACAAENKSSVFHYSLWPLLNLKEVSESTVR